VKRLGLALVLAITLTGCGAIADNAAERRSELAPAPDIRAVDRPIPDALAGWEFDDPDIWGVACAEGYIVDGGGNRVSEDDELDRLDEDECAEINADYTEIREEQRRLADALRPAPGSDPRAIAELAISGNATAELIVWRNAAGELCAITGISWPKSPPGRFLPAGECYPIGHCAQICLSTAARRDLLSGTVAASGDVLRIPKLDGTVLAYPLTGPLVPGSDRRVFMVELGRTYWQRLELLRSDDVVEAIELPPETREFERCTDAVLDGAPVAESDPRTNRWRECINAGAGAEKSEE
jgi:hypothetical protein